MSSEPLLSPNAQALAVLAEKQGFPALSRRVPMSEAGLRHYARGRRTPPADVRSKLLDAFGLPVDGWTGAARDASVDTEERDDGAEVVDDAPLLDRYRSLARTLEETLRRAQADRDTPARDVAQIGQALNRTYSSIAKITGETEPTLASIVRSVAWRTLLGRLEPVLAKNPDVAAAIAKALDESEES